MFVITHTLSVWTLGVVAAFIIITAAFVVAHRRTQRRIAELEAQQRKTERYIAALDHLFGNTASNRTRPPLRVVRACLGPLSAGAAFVSREAHSEPVRTVAASLVPRHRPATAISPPAMRPVRMSRERVPAPLAATPTTTPTRSVPVSPPPSAAPSPTPTPSGDCVNLDLPAFDLGGCVDTLLP